MYTFYLFFIHNSDKLVIMDGNFHNRSFQFLRIFGKYFVGENTYNSNTKTYNSNLIKIIFLQKIKEII